MFWCLQYSSTYAGTAAPLDPEATCANQGAQFSNIWCYFPIYLVRHLEFISTTLYVWTVGVHTRWFCHRAVRSRARSPLACSPPNPRPSIRRSCHRVVRSRARSPRAPIPQFLPARQSAAHAIRASPVDGRSGSRRPSMEWKVAPRPDPAIPPRPSILRSRNPRLARNPASPAVPQILARSP
jgi:hypothetical protein